MKVWLAALMTASSMVAFSQTAAIYSPVAVPYAIAHPYLSAPFVTLPQPANVVQLKHHTPEHTAEQQQMEQGQEMKAMEENKKEETDKLNPNLPVVYNLYPYSAVPIAVVSPLSPPGSQSQYRVQDELGQYQYGYSSPLSAKNEIKTFDGITRGSYSYIDSNGELQAVNYVADALGFRVIATNVPEQVKPVEIPDAPEVAEAKARLFALQQEHIAKVKAAEQEHITATEEQIAKVKAAEQALLTAPEIALEVVESPEVAEAKARLFALQEEHIAKVKAAEQEHLAKEQELIAKVKAIAEANENNVAEVLMSRLGEEAKPAENVVEAETKPKELSDAMDEKKDEDKKEEKMQ